ncbi:MAG: ShlB/FhaC/HecB family hemolysin secretion/activation protein [Nitrospiraceae bacterium]
MRRIRSRRALAVGGLVAALLWIPPLVSAQATAPSTTTAQPSNDTEGSRQELSPRPSIIRAVTVRGTTVFSQEDFIPLFTWYLHEPLTLATLEEVAAHVTDMYRARGYTLASTYVPQQEIRDGYVELAVLEGQLGALSVTGQRAYSEDFIRKHFAPVMEARLIRNQDVERSLLLLNGYPELKTSATLRPGATPGSTDLDVLVEDRRPIHLTLDYNNYGFNTVSRHRFGATGEIGNLGIDGSMLTLNGIIGDKPDQLLFGTASYAVPLGVHGTKLAASVSTGRFDVGAHLSALEIRGRISTYDLSLSHPLVKTRTQTVIVDTGFASKDNRLSTLGSLTGSDRVRLLKAGVNYDQLDGSGRTYASVYGFQGVGEVWGGMDNNDRLTTRQGADNRFTKGTVSAGRIQSLPHDLLFILKGSGQISTGPLVVIEQLLLGGPDSVRGYQLGERFVDEGYTVSGELRIPVWSSKLPPTQFGVFVDHGGGRVRNPAPGEHRSASLTGVGFGVQTMLSTWGQTSIRADLGFPLSAQPVGGTLSGDRSPTLYLQAIARF